MSQEITLKSKATAKRIGWIYIIFAPIIFFLIGLGCGQYYYQNYILVDFTKQKEEQYYRGTYDICRYLSMGPKQCLYNAKEFQNSGWFENKSEDWVWPIRVLKSGEEPG